MDLSKWKVGMAGRDDKGVLWRCMVLKPYAAMFARVTPSGSNVLAGFTTENESVNQVVARGPDLDDEATAALTYYVPVSKETLQERINAQTSIGAGAENNLPRKATLAPISVELERTGVRRRASI